MNRNDKYPQENIKSVFSEESLAAFKKTAELIRQDMGVLDDFVNETAKRAFDEVIDRVRLDWKEPVQSVSDLPEDDGEGATRWVVEESKVYRKYPNEWRVIQDMDLSALQEVDSRLTAQLAHEARRIYDLSKVTIRIDVTAPEETITGLKPYRSDLSEEENTKRVQAIFDYVRSNQVTYMDTGMSLYTGISFKVFFPKVIYTFSSTIEWKGSYLDVIADRAIIKTTHNDPVFKTTGTNGWNLNVKGFTFDRTGSCIYQDNENLEAGYTHISDCWFIDTKGVAITLNKQSSIGTIDRCKFHKCDYVLDHINVDRLHFIDNWLSEKPRWQSKDASIFVRKGRLLFEKNLVVPYPPEQNVEETAYINSYASVQCNENHFGGEPGSKTIVNVFKGGSNFNGSGGQPHIVEVNGSTDLNCIYGYTVIRLFSLPNRVNVKNNSGLYDSTVLIKWGDGVDQIAEIERFVTRKRFCKIDIADNLGNLMSVDASLSAIPSNLNVFLVNKVERTHFNSVINPKTQSITSATKSVRVSNVHTKRHYLVTSSVNPSIGSNYNSSFVGILSFRAWFDTAYRCTAVLTPIQDLPGGAPPISSSCNITVTFADTGLDTTSSQQNVQTILINYGDRVISGNIKIKDMYEGVLVVDNM